MLELSDGLDTRDLLGELTFFKEEGSLSSSLHPSANSSLIFALSGSISDSRVLKDCGKCDFLGEHALLKEEGCSSIAATSTFCGKRVLLTGLHSLSTSGLVTKLSDGCSIWRVSRFICPFLVTQSHSRGIAMSSPPLLGMCHDPFSDS
jgi:hypothetical protein